MEGAIFEIIDYSARHQPVFEQLNRHWIEKHFQMEQIDFEVLQRPDQHILKSGGAIFMAKFRQELVGTVAVKSLGHAVYELTKMAVNEEFQGRKIGRALAEAGIEWARNSGAQKIILYSNTKLATAISLYRNLGFEEIPVDGPYKRSDIKMELLFNAKTSVL